ncbi:MAG: nucleoside diphosphate kinase regulator [Anaerolineae bacterium]
MMHNRTIYITDPDMKLLRELLDTARRLNYYDQAELQKLEAELNRGQVVPSKQILPDVITMNSTVCLEDLDTGEEITCTLVFPHEADIDQNKISILAPVGIAMLGYRVGEVVEWPVPDGLSRLRIKAILYQPEASGEDEPVVVNVEPAGQEKWLDTMLRLSKHHEVFDDYN